MYSSIASRPETSLVAIASKSALRYVSENFCRGKSGIQPFHTSLSWRQTALNCWCLCFQEIRNGLQVGLLTDEVGLANLIFSLAPSPTTHLTSKRMSVPVFALKTHATPTA